MGMGGYGYGPLIDLSAASSHMEEFVQLVVFVHRSSPRQYKKGRAVRTDIDVGDETRPYFCISLWNPHLASSVSAGDILFFRNVKVIQFRSMVEAKSVEYTSILRLIHPYAALLSRGVDDLVTSCPVLVGTAKEKLRRVINWVHLTHSTPSPSPSLYPASASRNWKMPQELQSHECSLLSQVLRLSAPCKAIFHASIAQLYLHSLCHAPNKQDRLFICSRLPTNQGIILEDLICTGCLLCGIPMSSSLSTNVGNDDSPLFCHKSSNRLHTVGFIYRPFMLYVWDNSAYIPLLVKNKATEVLFGNIIAEKVYQSYKGHKDHLKNPSEAHVNHARDYRPVEEKGIGSISSARAMGLARETNHVAKGPNLYLIWLSLFKILLLQGQNSSLNFEALVNPCLAMEDGRFEMISMSMSPLNNHQFPLKP